MVTIINNSLTMISSRVMGHHFYIGLVCQNCFPHSVLVIIALSMAFSNFVKGPLRSNTMHQAGKFLLILYLFWRVAYNGPSKQILILILTDSGLINITHIMHTVLDIKSKHYKWNEFSWRCFPVNNANFSRTAFSIEHVRWLLLCLLERKEEESLEQGSEQKFFRSKKKIKTFKFYLLVLMLVKTEMQTKLCKY